MPYVACLIDYRKLGNAILRSTSFAVAPVLLPALLSMAAPVVAQSQNVDWLVGCWESFEDYSQEVWVKTPDAALLGFSVSVHDDNVSFYETLYVRVVGGKLTYTAYPSGQSPATFIAREVGDSSVVFENPTHDYPQRISYRLQEPVLSASISALSGEKKVVFEKQRCK